MGDAKALVTQHLGRLGLAATEVALPVDSTLTPRTLARSGAGPELEAQAEARAALPRISLDLRRAASAAPHAGAPDLALVATIGEGGMGRVHLARQQSLGRDVAVKTLKEDAPAQVAAALFREARVTGALEHPGVVPVHALGVDDEGRPLLVMKRVEGVDWRALLEKPNHPAWEGRPRDRLVANLEVLARVCETLEFAHSRRVVHRDIKPDNVMLGAFGEVYLMDWGIAKRLDEPEGGAPELVGTPAYMAPEMAVGGPVDERTDVYLLGATLHELVTGRYRHDAETFASALVLAARSEPVTYGASVPKDLADLANAATARDPSARPPSVRAFRERLDAFLRHRAVAAIVEAAQARLDELARALSDAGAAPPADLARAYRLANEARFGFAQSLRDHPDHAGARAGLRACLIAQADLELRQGHVESAEAVLAELGEPDAALAERVREARARADARRREEETLRRMAREHDPSVGEKWRTASMALLAAGLAGVSLALGLTGAVNTLTARGAFRVMAAVFVVLVAFLALLRKRILVNVYNRRLAALLMLGMLASVANRALGVRWDDPIRVVFVRDLLLYTVVILATAIAAAPECALAALCTGAALVGALLAPERAPSFFTAGGLGAMLVLGVVLRRRARRAGG